MNAPFPSRLGSPIRVLGAAVLLSALGPAHLVSQESHCDRDCIAAVQASLTWAAADLERLADEVELRIAPPVLLTAADRGQSARAGALDRGTLGAVAAGAPAWAAAIPSHEDYLSGVAACRDDLTAAACEAARGKSAVGVWSVRSAGSDRVHVDVGVEVVTARPGAVGVLTGRGARLEVERSASGWVVTDVVLRIAGSDQE